MLGNFSYCNPTKLYFGEDALQNLSTELKKIWGQCSPCLWRRIDQEKWDLRISSRYFKS